MRTHAMWFQTCIFMTIMNMYLLIHTGAAFSSIGTDRRIVKPGEEPETCRLVFPGGGIFFYWQIGVVCQLRESSESYDLSKCQFSGASAGALTATLASTGVDLYEATSIALSMAKGADVWNRRLGLQGIWGQLIEEWLEMLLPEDSISLVDERLMLLVTRLPSFGKSQVTNFRDRKDLIQCNMASIHLPWFLDGKVTSGFRGKPHIDGSIFSKGSDYLPAKKEENVLFLDWKSDPVMAPKGGLDIVETLSPGSIWGLLEQGKEFARILESDGYFDMLPKVSDRVTNVD